ncbi:LOW QUALITY PROTEIN: dihydrolipoamide acyltransferase component of branched-chain alpha-keto acid dehydrogenase complex [Geomicrobium sp. JCM 19039]|nr:LOW QUALITY PROTEIN: dihydrolipoamide acyltransferase component of branched-chain alpha-keto acid dehydrogenase complex [Geomicrobium sp. JCM 19039]
MAKEITMPQLGESVTEGTIDRWLVEVGDQVNKYDPLAEVTTDKVNAEVPSSFSGTIKELVVKEDTTVAVGDLIAYIETNDEEGPEREQERENKEPKEAPSTKEQTGDSSMKTRYSPAVLALAGEHGIDLQQLTGTGRGGRITRKDVEAYVAGSATRSAPQKQEAKSAPSDVSEQRQEPQSLRAGDERVPVSGVRKAIANRMTQSVQEIPHAWTMVEVDVTNLVRYRERIKGSWKEKRGYSLTYMPFFMETVAQALKRHPVLNATWDKDAIVYKKEINLSVAIATDDALFVPVVHHADELNVNGFARKLHELADKTRSNTLSNTDMAGGTFTINNTGSFGSIQSVPIINHPQAAILSVESIVKRPIVQKDDSIAIRSMVNLCLSIDHRVLDGLAAGRFLQDVKHELESFSHE